MTTSGNILVIDDDKDVLLAARLLLQQHFSTVRCISDPGEILGLMSAELYDVILLDMNFTDNSTSGIEGFYWLSKILEVDPKAIVVLITAYGDVEKAVKAIRKGATDFILKPWQNERLIATVTTAYSLRKTRVEVERLERSQKQLCADIDAPFHEMIGSCTEMKQVFATMEKVAKTDVNVLILGENGTGKELVARGLHRASARSEQLFISVDMGAIAENLFESELFGHEKGAFTDALDTRLGRFEIASGGSLFLDEISNLNFTLQAKLLRVLETRVLTRIGSNEQISVDIRVISATNSQIYDLVESKSFRQDLLYRLNTVEIHLPPLRDRGDDIVDLAYHFLKRFSRKYNKKKIEISDAALKKLKKYDWPGNVRELSHCIERALIMSETSTLNVDDFLLRTTLQEEDFSTYNLKELEKKVIAAVLKKNSGNISRAAADLGLTRAALYRRMEKYDL